jgi:catechol 2,3-dioxygenase
MDTRRLDFESLMAELAGDAQPWTGLPSDTAMGHIHLQVADISAAQQFYLNVLGFGHILSIPTASFISAGGYHHHIGMNVWAGVGVPPPPEDAARLISYEILLPDAAALATVLEQVQAADIEVREQADGWVVRDPSKIEIFLRAARHSSLHTVG